jgi:cell division protein FtsB
MPDSLAKQIIFSKPAIVVEIVILGFFTLNAGKEILERRAIEAEISKLEAEISKLEHKEDELGALLEFVQTDSFVEQEARAKLNLAKAGESLVVIPEVDVREENAGIIPNIQGTVAGESHFSLWWKYFFEHAQLSEE